MMRDKEKDYLQYLLPYKNNKTNLLWLWLDDFIIILMDVSRITR